MTFGEAIDLLAPALGPRGGIWADLGAGGGTLTAALAALLGPTGLIYAVDSDDRAVAGLRRLARQLPVSDAAVLALHGDIENLDAIPRLGDALLSGALLANVLHYLPQPERVLAPIAARLVASGRVVVIEYDGVAPNRWVPHPLPRQRLAEVAAAAGLGPPEVVDSRASQYGGTLYCAVLERRGAEKEARK
jgi:SAM-dependent methyltransferase